MTKRDFANLLRALGRLRQNRKLQAYRDLVSKKKEWGDFADMTTLKILRWDNYPGLSRLPGYNHKVPYKREA
jgi:hypothetical protein